MPHFSSNTLLFARPLQGATVYALPISTGSKFLLTRPLRGATKLDKMCIRDSLYTFVLIRMETELTHQQVSLLRRNYLHIGIFLQYLLDAGRVVGFQVIDDYPVERTSIQHVFQIFLKLSVGCLLYTSRCV